MCEQLDSNKPPTLAEVRKLLSELRLWEFLNRQNRQIPVIIAVANSPEYFGLCPLTEESILDRRYQHLSTMEKNNTYDSWITDLSVEVNNYYTYFQKGYSSPTEEPDYESLHVGNARYILEVKKDAWEFLRQCVGVDVPGKSAPVETGYTRRGHIIQPLHRGTHSELESDRTQGVVVGIDKAIFPESDGSSETILKNLTKKGLISGSHLRRVEHGGRIRAAPIIRELGIPCTVLHEHPDVFYPKIDGDIQLLNEQNHPAKKSKA